MAEQAAEEARQATLQTRAEMKERLIKQVELLEKSGFPDRRRQGLDLISETVGLDPDAEQRFKLRDLAMKFQVLRQVEAHDSELATGRAHGLAFGPRGNRLAVLSEDQEELAIWDVGKRQRVMTLSLRGETGIAIGPLAPRAVSEPGSVDQGGDNAQAAGLNSGRNGSGAVPGATRSPSFDGRRLAPTEQYVATIVPDNTGVRLIDVASGALLRSLHPLERVQVLSVLADPAGQRLITIERVVPDDVAAVIDQNYDFPEAFGEFQVNLWDPDNLDKLRTLNWTPAPPRGRSNSASSPPPQARSSVPPLVAISPDGKTVAVAALRGGMVRLFSGDDGLPVGGGGGRPIVTQPELTALALGPNSLLATAGGGIVRLWNVDRESRTALPELPIAQNFTRKLKFSPQGNLLAIAGLGPIELWDPVAHALVGVLKTTEQINDLAFSPDGKTLAVVDRAGMTSLWAVTDPAIRTQLSGIDARPLSLAFGTDGILAGGGWNGNVWFWRKGRCPEVSSPLPLSTPNHDEPGPPPARPAPAAASPGRQVGKGSTPEPTSSTSPGSTPAANGSNASEPSRPNGPGGRGGRGGPGTGRPRDGDRDPRPTMLAFDAEGRLVAHDIKGLRIWPPGSLPGLTPPMLQNPLSAPAKRQRFNLMPMAGTTDGRTMVFVRSTAVFLWHVDAVDKVVPVIPPPHSGSEPSSPVLSGPQRGTTAGTDSLAPIFHVVRIAPRGDRIYLIDQIGRLHVWGLDHGSEVEAGPIRAHELDWSIPAAEGGFSNLALRGDGAILALGDRTQTVTLINTANQAILGRITPPGGEAESYWLAMQFAPDRPELAVGSEQGIISVWSIAQPNRPRLRFQLPGHRGMTTSLVFDTQGRRLASAGMDPLVEVWDLELIERELAQLKLAD